MYYMYLALLIIVYDWMIYEDNVIHLYTKILLLKLYDLTALYVLIILCIETYSILYMYYVNLLDGMTAKQNYI